MVKTRNARKVTNSKIANSYEHAIVQEKPAEQSPMIMVATPEILSMSKQKSASPEAFTQTAEVIPRMRTQIDDAQDVIRLPTASFPATINKSNWMIARNVGNQDIAIIQQTNYVNKGKGKGKGKGKVTARTFYTIFFFLLWSTQVSIY